MEKFNRCPAAHPLDGQAKGPVRLSAAVGVFSGKALTRPESERKTNEMSSRMGSRFFTNLL